ncbi:MAG TPA: UDP-N-acetylmuramoyl-L-alanyl-D-glutamate--2,6-diaminopimelate ligase [Actinomycetota bacterium]|nr:UDP-N-acetylmuramoyl-L-alanyl-D-glutamate--2,6-diaminopimelate ligase [Actinomycetota bacterium]
MTPEPSFTQELGSLARAAGDALVSLTGEGATPITGVTLDSRRVSEGDIFFCVPGLLQDRHEFAPAAIEAGAAALVVERPLRLGVPEVRVTDARVAMARMGAEFYGRPADDLMLLGVTGTSGKTTTTWLLEPILAAAGHVAGLIGTIETRIAGEPRPGVRTTPDSLDLQRTLAEMRAAGVTAVALEVTSHALSLHRVETLYFEAAAFTNLTQDHLDFHTGMEDYFEAKRSLFVPERVGHGAINVDDAYGRTIKESATVDMVGFGVAPDADVRAESLRTGPWGMEFVALSPLGELKIKVPLIGQFNLSNCLAAVSVALEAGIDPSAIEAGLQSVKAVPGRFEAVDAGQPFSVVVDYSHKPDALDNVLREARRIARQKDKGRVICVFGCGGDRDRAKRPLMGQVAAVGADIVVVTSDNPRSEDPDAIIAEIVQGVTVKRSDGPDESIVDRRAAIEFAIHAARDGDVIVIAGKGHESGQVFADHTEPFDDRVVTREALAAAGWSA